MTALLPNNYTVVTAQGSQWSAIFQIQNDDGSLADLTNKVFEFVVRDRLTPASQIVFSVNSTTSTAYGEIVVTLSTSSLQVIVNAAATVLLSEGGGPYTLWMDQNLADATALVTGVFLASPVANP
jgi:hypothetical protein